MRETLFRGKRKDNGEWAYGDILKSDEQRFIVPVMGVSCVEEYEHADTNKFIQLYAYEVIPETVCQYTGMTDKNGRKIFEGDICKTKFFGKDDGNGHNFSDYDIFKVAFKDGIYLLENNKRQFSTQYIPDMAGDGIEVIGNIYDNPELLKKASEPHANKI